MLKQWKEAPGFPDYEISDEGDVRRAKPGRGAVVGKIVKPWIDKDGRLSVTIRTGGETKTVRPSRLVAIAFIGPPPFDGAEACHWNGKPSDNRVKNLRWDTDAGNKADMIRHGTKVHRGRHGMAKLSHQQVTWIRKRVARGETQASVGAIYGVSQTQVGRIVRGKRWANASA